MGAEERERSVWSIKLYFVNEQLAPLNNMLMRGLTLKSIVTLVHIVIEVFLIEVELCCKKEEVKMQQSSASRTIY